MAEDMLGRGTTLSYRAEAAVDPAAWTALATVISIEPSITVGEVETTVLASEFEDYMPTIPAGECAITVSHRNADAGCQALAASVDETPVVQQWKIEYVDGYIETFKGFAKGYSKKGIQNKERVTAELSIRLKTKITRTAPDPG
jgi:hypothetical protein